MKCERKGQGTEPCGGLLVVTDIYEEFIFASTPTPALRCVNCGDYTFRDPPEEKIPGLKVPQLPKAQKIMNAKKKILDKKKIA